MSVTGSCLCGAVTYEVAGPFEFMGNCHCSICRKSHGAPFATWGIVKPEHFRWTRPREHIFVGSKAPWHEISDQLPQHEEWPPESGS